MDRIISSFLKAFSIYSIVFSVNIVFLAFGAYFMGEDINPKNVFILVWMCLCLSIISTIEFSLAGWHLWNGMPYWIKKLIVMPFHLAVIIIGILNIWQLGAQIKRYVILILVIGVTFYLIGVIIKYISERKQTDRMNNALIILQKEIEKKDEQEY